MNDLSPLMTCVYIHERDTYYTREQNLYSRRLHTLTKHSMAEEYKKTSFAFAVSGLVIAVLPFYIINYPLMYFLRYVFQTQVTLNESQDMRVVHRSIFIYFLHIGASKCALGCFFFFIEARLKLCNTFSNFIILSKRTGSCFLKRRNVNFERHTRAHSLFFVRCA
jgi:hypothetical protein